MTTLITTRLGDHRGHKRLWLEGSKLEREGFVPGLKYGLTISGSKAIIRAQSGGQFTVSKRTRNGSTKPIIDLKADELAALFDGVEKLRVAIKDGAIMISAHHKHNRGIERVCRLHSKLAEGKPVDVASLFHGGGVLDRAVHEGLKRAGVKSRLALAVEAQAPYLEASLANNPMLWDRETIAIQSAVEDVDLGRNPPQVDVLVAGIPCTGASRSGRSKNQLLFAESHEAAGAMFFTFLRFVEALNPAVVIIENVPEYASTASMVVIRSVLGSLGYQLSEAVLNGNDFGALENRNRLCAVGVSNGIDGFDVSAVKPSRKKPACLNEVLETIPANSKRWKSFDYLAEKEKRDKKAGKGFGRQLLTGKEAFCGTIGRGYAKCRSTEPFIVSPYDPTKSRILTPAEHAKVKGVPSDVVAGLSDTVAHQVLGQSVIFPVFDALGAALGGHLLKSQTAIAA